MTPDRIERRITIDAPVARVWQLITEPEHLGTWLGDAGATVDLRPGGAIDITWRKYGTSRARIEHIEPEKRFAFRWVPFVDARGVEPDATNSTLVEFTLEPQGPDTTALTLIETGFAALAADRRDEAYRDNTDGWTNELAELERYADPDRIERSVVIDAPVERVWQLISEPEHLGTWFADAGAAVDLRPGGRLDLRWADHGTSRGRIEEVEPGRRLAFRGLAEFDAPDDAEPAPGNSTRVEFTLEPDGDKTRVTVVESGFAQLPPEQRNELRWGNVEGWRITFDKLRDYTRDRAAA